MPYINFPAKKVFRCRRVMHHRRFMDVICPEDDPHAKLKLNFYCRTTDHQFLKVMKLVSYPFHQQKPKQMVQVVERMKARPTRFDSFQDQRLELY